MNFGFVIDNRFCIGCHACSVACKSENPVPLGVNRTWVKYVERGLFPHARRYFQVTRCNHCANPPCVRICPVEAMYQRHDGIVDFDPRICIGCKACMQACPYDAIYIDPSSGTAAKCHYCAHRTEIGLEPACVVVCPEQAIIAGDLDDPTSRINHLVSTNTVSVRKPEQGTSPKLFYIEGDIVSLTPTATHAPGSFLWADVATDQARVVHPGGVNGHVNGKATAQHGTADVAIRRAGPQGLGAAGAPIFIGGARVAEQMVQTAYNAQHKVPWHWPVPAYLVTKGIAAGVFLLLAALFVFGLVPFNRPLAMAGALTSLVFTGLTTVFLVIDLDRPERFHTILTRPQWKSWLTRGAFILIGFTIVVGLWLLIEAGANFGFASSDLAASARPWLLGFGSLLAIGTAAYTAFLFGQAEGRDLWQSPLLPVHLVVQALTAGAAVLLALLFLGDPLFQWAFDAVHIAMWGGEYPMTRVFDVLLPTFVAMLVIDLFVTLVGEFGVPHGSEVAARAAHEIDGGRYSNHFWLGSITVGHVLPLVLLGVIAATDLGYYTTNGLVLVASLATLIGLYLYEHAYVMAPQEVPNS